MTINNQSVVQYKFKISRPGQKDWYIFKRYNDFYELDQSLKLRYRNLVEIKKLDQPPKDYPELPPKVSAFGLRTSVAYRGPRLQQFLNDLFKLPLIGQSFSFRKFIEISSQSQISVMIEQSKSNNSSYFKMSHERSMQCIEDINVEDLQTNFQKNINSAFLTNYD